MSNTPAFYRPQHDIHHPPDRTDHESGELSEPHPDRPLFVYTAGHRFEFNAEPRGRVEKPFDVLRVFLRALRSSALNRNPWRLTRSVRRLARTGGACLPKRSLPFRAAAKRGAAENAKKSQRSKTI